LPSSSSADKAAEARVGLRMAATTTSVSMVSLSHLQYHIASDVILGRLVIRRDPGELVATQLLESVGERPEPQTAGMPQEFGTRPRLGAASPKKRPRGFNELHAWTGNPR
jgi:hypothetical protein